MIIIIILKKLNKLKIFLYEIWNNNKLTGQQHLHLRIPSSEISLKISPSVHLFRALLFIPMISAKSIETTINSHFLQCFCCCPPIILSFLVLKKKYLCYNLFTVLLAFATHDEPFIFIYNIYMLVSGKNLIFKQEEKKVGRRKKNKRKGNIDINK